MAYLGNAPGQSTQRVTTTFTATEGQTSFTPVSGYTPGYVDVYLNGVKLIDTDDYVATNGVTIVLNTASSVDNTLEVVAYIPRGLSDGYTKLEADARYEPIDSAYTKAEADGRYATEAQGTLADSAVQPDDNVSFGTGSFSGEISANGGIALGDNDKAKFGASGDLQIYHHNSRSYIADTGAGQLYIRGSAATHLENANGSKKYARFVDGAAAELYYDNSQKLATTSTGIDVTGTVTADGLTVDVGDKIFTTNTNVDPVYISRNGAKNQALTIGVDDNTAFLKSIQDEQYGGFAFQSAYDGVGTQNRLVIARNGDISFYEDTGTTAKFFWDASAESLGIGETSPTAQLHLSSDVGNTIQLETFVGNGNDSTFKFRKARGGINGPYQISAGDDLGTIEWNGYDGSSWNSAASIKVTSTTNTGDFDAVMSFNTGSERMRIDSSGNVGIGTSSPTADLTVNGSGVIGQIANGAHNTSLTTLRSGTPPELIVGFGAPATVATPSATTEFIVARDNNVSMALVTGSANKAYIRYSDDDNEYAGALAYDHSVDAHKIIVNNSTKMTVNNTGVGIGTSSPSAKLDVAGQVNANAIKANKSIPVTSKDTSTGHSFNYVITNSGGNGATWRKVADITFNASAYAAMTIEVETVLGYDNYGGISAGWDRVEYVVGVAYSAGALGSPDNATITGGVGVNQLRVQKTSSGVFELQCRTNANNKTMQVKCNVIQNENGFITPATSLVAGSTTGTSYVPSTTGGQNLYTGSLILNDGVYLGGTGSANKLDDYEEGSWTPVFTSSGTNPTITYINPGSYSGTYGRYIKVGGFVYLYGRIQISTISGGSGALYLSGIPFTKTSDNSDIAGLNVSVVFSSWAANNYPVTGFLTPSPSGFRLKTYDSDDPRDGLDTDILTFPSSGAGLLFSAVYKTNQ